MSQGKPEKGSEAKKDCEFFLENFLFEPKRKLVEVSAFARVRGKSGQIILQANKQLLDEICTVLEEQKEFEDWIKVNDKIKTCLWQLISFYGQKRRNHLNTRSPGRNTAARKTAWTTARVLFPGLLLWANDEENKRTRPYKTIEKALEKENYKKITPDRIAAFIIRTNMKNSGAQYVRFSSKDPCVDPYRFQQRLNQQEPFWSGYVFNKGQSKIDFPNMKREEFVEPPGIKFLIRAILDGASWQVSTCITNSAILLEKIF